MKANIEKVPQRLGSSWRYKKIIAANKPSDWHFHNEYELVLHRHFQGKAYLGHYQGDFEHNSLILIPPNTPHMFDSIGNTSGYCETHIFWFKAEWIANMMFSCAELRKIETLLKRAKKGLTFSEQSGQQVFELVGKIPENSAISQLATLLQILDVLCIDANSQTLQSFSSAIETHKKEEKDKLNKICLYIEQHYHQSISLSDLARYMYTSESSVHRIFETHFNENFSLYLKKYRLNHAAELLTSTSMAISLITEKVGYRNQANFNRQFKAYKKLTPSAYRNEFKLASKQ